MNNFVYFIFSELQGALGLAIIAAIVCIIGLMGVFLVFRKKQKEDTKFPWGKAICILLLVGYIAGLIYITLLRGAGYGTRYVNLHLFRAWREAWNSFAFKSWMNILLNVAMFIPLGAIVPVLLSGKKRFQKWYIMLIAGLGVSFLIEILQFLMKKGLFDVDDLFTNTLGTMIGYCIAMFLLSFKEKKELGWRVRLTYLVLPVVTVMVFGGFWGAYHLQEYGNLTTASSYTVDTKDVIWETSLEFDDTQQEVAVYQTEPFDKSSCKEFGYEFFARIGTEIQDVDYYDNETWFMNHSTPGQFLMVSNLDRSYRFSCVESDVEVWGETDEDTIRKLLEGYGIQVPENAVFTYEGDGLHQFTIEQYVDEDIMLDGILQCYYTQNGKLRDINNHLVSYCFRGNEPVISSKEAYKMLCAGKFSEGESFEYYAPRTIEVRSCSLEYQVDTKGFYQPVYVFEVVEPQGVYEGKVMIPALE